MDLANIEGDEIVNRIKIATIPMAFEVALEGEDDCKLVDAARFAPGLVLELNREQENGDTPVHRILDHAILQALEMGAEGVDYDLKTSARSDE